MGFRLICHSLKSAEERKVKKGCYNKIEDEFYSRMKQKTLENEKHERCSQLLAMVLVRT